MLEYLQIFNNILFPLLLIIIVNAPYHTQESNSSYRAVGVWKILFQTDSVFANDNQDSKTIILNNRSQNLWGKIRK